MVERLRPVPGFAIIGRFHYSGEGDKRRVQSVAQFELTPEQGLLFLEAQGAPEEPISLTQETMADALQSIPPGKHVQLLALMDQSGNLLFTAGAAEESYGLKQDLPQNQRVMNVQSGNTFFAGILGKSKEEASRMLISLQEARRKLN